MALLEQVRDSQAAGKIIYTAKVHTIGGRENGEARSSDGQLDVKLSVPGTSRPGTNPEQLFAAGWSACFEGAIGVVAQRRKIKLSGLAIDAEVNLHAANGEYSLSARFNVSLPGLDREVADLWSRPPSRSVRIRRSRAAISTWSSTSFEPRRAPTAQAASSALAAFRLVKWRVPASLLRCRQCAKRKSAQRRGTLGRGRRDVRGGGFSLARWGRAAQAFRFSGA